MSLILSALARTIQAYRTRQFSVVVVSMLAVSVGETVYLMRANEALKSALSRTKSDLRGDAFVKEGDRLPTLVGFDVTGAWQSFAPRGGRSLVVTFSADCQACTSSRTAFRQLATEAIARGMRAVWVCKDSVSPSSRGGAPDDLPGLFLLEPTYLTHVAVKLSAVPQTLVVSEEGIVQRVWIGQLDETKEKEIRAEISRQSGS